MYRNISNRAVGNDFPAAVLPSPATAVMAGCVSVSQALSWSKGRNMSDILDLMTALEANTLDLYLKLGRQVDSDRARKVFFALAETEKVQLDALISALEQTVGAKKS